MGIYYLVNNFIFHTTTMETWLTNWLYSTGGFAVLMVLMCIIGALLGNSSGRNKYEKGVYRSTGLVSATFMSLCLWLMYTCAYFHQVYPMVTPDFENPNEPAS